MLLLLHLPDLNVLVYESFHCCSLQQSDINQDGLSKLLASSHSSHEYTSKFYTTFILHFFFLRLKHGHARQRQAGEKIVFFVLKKEIWLG